MENLSTENNAEEGNPAPPPRRGSAYLRRNAFAISSLTAVVLVKVFRWASAYIVSTTLLSMVLGLVLVLTIKPGLDAAGQDDAEESSSIFIALMDLSWNIFPENLFTAAIIHYKTERDELEIEPGDPGFRLDTNTSEVEMRSESLEGANLLGLVVFGFAFAAALSRMQTYLQPVFINQIAAFNKFSRVYIQRCLR
ncbi:Excitatory amino acid transporter 3 [Liparis tanakae]|uniref:Amino acid transporter n=1 Tax=Liparis tanakae TaxID=230148 RepID=A0A4Z2ESS8_9TELE|nr:Excitatory amino acid transporter 3 [Liparis tanakae]